MSKRGSSKAKQNGKANRSSASHTWTKAGRSTPSNVKGAVYSRLPGNTSTPLPVKPPKTGAKKK